jgi:hypothetical protein
MAEEASMPSMTKKSFDSPDETRTPEKTKLEVVELGASKAARLTAQPGWRWSECIKPIVGGDSCQTRHFGLVSSGRIQLHHDDGSEMELGPGDAYVIEPGHDAWVVGDEPFVAFEFESASAETYGRSPNA